MFVIQKLCYFSNDSSGVVEVSELGITTKQRADKAILFPMFLNTFRLFLKLSFIGRDKLIVWHQGSILKSAVQCSSIGTRQRGHKRNLFELE